MAGIESGFVGQGKRNPITAKEKIDTSVAGGTPGATAFPSDLGDHQFIMTFYDYQLNPDGGQSENVTGTIAFPLPTSGMADKSEINYNASELGVAGAAASGMAGALMTALENSPTEGNQSETDYSKLVGDLMQGGAAFVAETVGGTNVGQGISLGLGITTNPHVALLFKGMGLKTFSFSWKFAPRSQAESDILKNIIKDLKKKSHPKYRSEGNNFFLKYPNEVDLFYYGSGDYLHYFKRAAITGMEVNYQPDGTAVMAGTGAPAFVELTLQFQETQIWTAEDFE